MNKEKAKMLNEVLGHYKDLLKNNSVNLIEFKTVDGKNHGIGNPAAIKLLLTVAIIELERQLHVEQFGGLPEQLEQSREYKAAKELENAMNDFSFNPERFAESLPYFHKTMEQTFFRTVRASILAMTERAPCRIDGRNEASYEMCKQLAPMLQETYLPFI